MTTGLTFAVALGLLLVLSHLLESLQIPLVSLVSGQVSEWTLARKHTLHGLAASHRRTRVSLAGQLASHLRQTVDSEVHGNIVDALETIGRLATGHVLEDDVIELMHEDAKLMLVLECAHELRVVKQLELGSMRVDTDASGRDAGARGLVDATRQSSEERLAHEQASSVHVEIEGLDGLVVGHESLLITYII